MLAVICRPQFPKELLEHPHDLASGLSEGERSRDQG